MGSSDCSSTAESSAAVVLAAHKTIAAMEENAVPPYRLQTRNNIPRRYQRKDDTLPMTTSPTVSEAMDADEPLDQSYHNDDDSGREEQDEDGWDTNDEHIFEQRIYESPRIIMEDADVFPSEGTRTFYQNKGELRWQRISQQAGPHQQDGSILVIQRNIKPATLKNGIMQHYVGARVRTISLWLNPDEDLLPQWLDVLATFFPNLEHISLTQGQAEWEEEIEVSSRMRRLYILYRLPDLLSIDDVPVTQVERALAHPTSPNGERVHRSDWIEKQTSLMDEIDDDDDDEDELAEREEPALDSLEVPASMSMGSRTAMELGTELAQLTAQMIMENAGTDKGGPNVEGFDDDDSLFGEELLTLVASSSNSASFTENEVVNRKAVDAGTTGNDRPANPGNTPLPMHATHQKELLPSHSVLASRDADHREIATAEKPRRINERSCVSQRQRGLLKQSSLDDTYELVSVASSHHEWTAACGVLSFRSDRTCAPRLRLNILGGNRKRAANNEEKVPSSPNQASKDIHPKGQENSQPTPALPQPDVTSGETGTTFCPVPLSPQHSDRSLNGGNRSSSPPSPNQILPPSKSLSSPFPMQFRERKSPLRVSTEERDLIMNGAEAKDTTKPSAPRASAVPSLLETISRPAMVSALGLSTSPTLTPPIPGQKPPAMLGSSEMKPNGLPPTCPSKTRRKVVAASLLQRDTHERKQARKARRMERRKKAFQETARSTSVFDDMDDDDEDHEEDTDSDESCVHENAEVDAILQDLQNDASVHNGNDW